MTTSPSLQTLFLPLEQGLIEARTPVLFLGAGWNSHLSAIKDHVHCWQPFFPAAEKLRAHGFEILDDIPESGAYGLVLIDLPKQVEEAQFWLAQGLKLCAPDGMVSACAPNDANGNRIQKWMTELDMETDATSKNKAKVVWGKRPRSKPAILDEWLEFGGLQELESDEGHVFVSQPGLFGWSKIDQGSALLADEMITPLAGVGADFGCGYGYLSQRILEKNVGIETLLLIDADSRAIACAEENLMNVQGGRTIQYYWADLSQKIDGLPPLDFIVMNPPFHIGKNTDPMLGQSFIKTAAHHLKKGGKLWMVANAHLPYEKTLNDNFKTVRVVIEKEGFKIFEAIA